MLSATYLSRGLGAPTDYVARVRERCNPGGETKYSPCDCRDWLKGLYTGPLDGNWRELIRVAGAAMFHESHHPPVMAYVWGSCKPGSDQPDMHAWAAEVLWTFKHYDVPGALSAANAAFGKYQDDEKHEAMLLRLIDVTDAADDQKYPDLTAKAILFLKSLESSAPTAAIRKKASEQLAYLAKKKQQPTVTIPVQPPPPPPKPVVPLVLPYGPKPKMMSKPMIAGFVGVLALAGVAVAYAIKKRSS